MIIEYFHYNETSMLHVYPKHKIHTFICFGRHKPKTTKFKLRKKVAQNNLKITAKSHAHFQTVTKIPAKFPNLG